MSTRAKSVRIVLIGDRDERVLAHRAIDASLQLLDAELPCRIEWLSAAALPRAFKEKGIAPGDSA